MQLPLPKDSITVEAVQFETIPATPTLVEGVTPSFAELMLPEIGLDGMKPATHEWHLNTADAQESRILASCIGDPSLAAASTNSRSGPISAAIRTHQDEIVQRVHIGLVAHAEGNSAGSPVLPGKKSGIPKLENEPVWKATAGDFRRSENYSHVAFEDGNRTKPQLANSLVASDSRRAPPNINDAANLRVSAGLANAGQKETLNFGSRPASFAKRLNSSIDIAATPETDKVMSRPSSSGNRTIERENVSAELGKPDGKPKEAVSPKISLVAHPERGCTYQPHSGAFQKDAGHYSEAVPTAPMHSNDDATENVTRTKIKESVFDLAPPKEWTSPATRPQERSRATSENPNFRPTETRTLRSGQPVLDDPPVNMTRGSDVVFKSSAEPERHKNSAVVQVFVDRGYETTQSRSRADEQSKTVLRSENRSKVISQSVGSNGQGPQKPIASLMSMPRGGEESLKEGVADSSDVDLPQSLAEFFEPAKRSDVATSRLEPSRPISQQLIDVARRLPEGSVEVRLSPEELGRVRLAIVPGESGLIVHIQADQATTLDLMRRHIDILQNELRGAGFGNVSFSFGQGQSDRQTQRIHAVRQVRSDELQPTRRSESSPVSLSTKRLLSKGGMDLRL